MTQHTNILVLFPSQDDLDTTFGAPLFFQTQSPEAERLGSGLQTEQGGLNPKGTDPEEHNDTLRWCSPATHQSNHPHTLNSVADFTCDISSSYHHPVMSNTCTLCVHELLPLPLLDCTSNHLSYNYHDIGDKSLRASFCFGVINNSNCITVITLWMDEIASLYFLPSFCSTQSLSVFDSLD